MSFPLTCRLTTHANREFSHVRTVANTKLDGETVERMKRLSPRPCAPHFRGTLALEAQGWLEFRVREGIRRVSSSLMSGSGEVLLPPSDRPAFKETCGYLRLLGRSSASAAARFKERISSSRPQTSLHFPFFAKIYFVQLSKSSPCDEKTKTKSK